MSKRPNIFDYAKKELSQDAMVCWFLNCCHSEDKTYKNIGLDFIEFILEDTNIDKNDIELEKNSPHAQYYHMDVYANIRVGNEIIPVIFEDKTDTFLHGEQEKRYTEMVNGWKNDEKWKKELFGNDNLRWSKNTRYIFFKTGYVFDWQREEIKDLKTAVNAKIKAVYIDDMIEFAAKHKDKDFLISDYYEHLIKRKSELADGIEDKCNRYFYKIFGDKKHFQYSYQQWAARNFGYIEDNRKKSENTINYALRTGWRKNGDKYSYSIAVQQYRNEKTLFGNKEEKEHLIEQRYDITNEAREICKMIATDLGVEIKLMNNTKKRMPSQNNLFVRFIDNDNEDEVCEFFRNFIKKFNIIAKEKYKDKYVIC